MPIGFTTGNFGGSTAWRSPDAGSGPHNPWRQLPETPPETGFWTWVEVDASTVYPVVWTRWLTRADERVCPECGPLNGLAWEETEGPAPPLHINCRCERAHAFTEWRTRYATTWELRWIAL